MRVIENATDGHPFFLYVPFNAPHTPLQVPADLTPRRSHLMNENRRNYAEMVACLDDQVGRMVAGLRNRGMIENTLIAFSSDNGGLPGYGGVNLPFRAGKGTLYEGGVRVCAFACRPGIIKAGTVVNKPLHAVGWLPTLIRLAGGSVPQQPPLDGRKIWPVLTAAAESPHKEILLNVTRAAGAIHRGKWKFIENVGLSANDPRHNRNPDPPAHVELFDLDSDPGETDNLADRHPEIVEELRARLEAYRKASAPARIAREPAGFKPPEVWGEE